MGNVNVGASSSSSSTTTNRGSRSSRTSGSSFPGAGRSSSSDNSWTAWSKSSSASSWDERTVGQLVSEGKVAPKGGRKSDDDDGIECPICFFSYEAVNYASCCSQPICTTCYLEIRPPRSRDVCCPFCGKDDFSARVDAKKRASSWEQKAAKDELHFNVASKPSGGAKVAIADDQEDIIKKEASLEQKERARVASIDERARIEEEMRKQLETSRSRGDSPAVPPEPPRPASLGNFGLGGGGRRRAHARAARLAADGNLTFEDIHALLHALPTDLHQVEELMVLEAMQASLEEEERRRQRLEHEEEAKANNETESLPAEEENATTSEEEETTTNNESETLSSEDMMAAGGLVAVNLGNTADEPADIQHEEPTSR